MLKNILVWTARCLTIGLVCQAVVIGMFRVVPPCITPLMVQRILQFPFKGNSPQINHIWVSYDHVSPWIFRGVIAGEDGKFLTHHGIDWQAVEHAKKVNASRIKRGQQPLGASTISMQTAKNIFLLPIRSMIRKAAEVAYTYAIEAVWGKRRILEVYVNMIEWGDGIYGIEAASQKYFNKHAEDLTQDEAIRLVAVVPNPRKFSPLQPTGYVRHRIAFIQGRKEVAIPK